MSGTYRCGLSLLLLFVVVAGLLSVKEELRAPSFFSVKTSADYSSLLQAPQLSLQGTRDMAAETTPVRELSSSKGRLFFKEDRLRSIPGDTPQCMTQPLMLFSKQRSGFHFFRSLLDQHPKSRFAQVTIFS